MRRDARVIRLYRGGHRRLKVEPRQGKEAAMSTSWIKRLTRLVRRDRCPECGQPVREAYCDVCGYDLIRQTRDSAFRRPVV